MSKIEEALAEIKKRLRIKGVFAVVLYGSVARGDYSLRHSDIDILVVLSSDVKGKVDRLVNDINMKYRVKIHPEYQSVVVRNEDQTLLCKMFEEGRVIFSKGFWFMDKKTLGLGAFRLYRFNTSSLDRVSRVMLSRALHGRKGLNGLIDDINVIDSGKGGLLVRKNMFKDIESFFERFKVKYKIVKTFYG